MVLLTHVPHAVLCLGARLLGVIICWMVFVSPLNNHLKNAEQESLD